MGDDLFRSFTDFTLGFLYFVYYLFIIIIGFWMAGNINCDQLMLC